MSADGESYEARPFLKIRRAYLHNFEASRRKNFIHGLVEMDVTEIRRAVRLREAAGEDISFTAVVMHAIARAVDEDRSQVHTPPSRVAGEAPPPRRLPALSAGRDGEECL
jgi:hypothetical protein